MKTRFIIAGVATALIVGTTMKLQSNKKIVDENIYRPDLNKKVLVQAIEAGFKVFDKIFSYTGTLTPVREVMIIPQSHGEVKGVFFKEGDVVAKGKLLVKIDDDLLQAQYASADVNLKTANRNLARYQHASASGGVSELQLDNLKLSLKQAESQTNQLRKQIEMTQITAPFAGTITYRDVEIGSLAGTSAVARISDLSRLKLKISVPEKEIGMFRKGAAADVTTDVYAGMVFRGTITYVSDRADHAHNYDVHVEIPNTSSNKLRAGMYGTLKLQSGLGHGSIVIPRTALIGSAKNPQVFIIDQNRARLVSIKTGRSNGEMVEVLEGIAGGNKVITSGHINLSDGSNIEVAK